MRIRSTFYALSVLMMLAITWSAASVAHAGTCQGSDVGTCGDSGDNMLVGTYFSEEFHGYGGSDIIWAFGGRDVVYGDAGSDTIYGDKCGEAFPISVCYHPDIAGRGDTLHGGAGADKIIGGEGDDFIDGCGGADTINGGTGNDTIHAGFAKCLYEINCDVAAGGCDPDPDPLADAQADVIDCGEHKGDDDIVYLGPDELNADGKPKRTIINCERIRKV